MKAKIKEGKMPTKKTLLTSLSTWLFKRPVLFTVYYFLIMIGITAIFAAIHSWFNLQDMSVYLLTLLISFLLSAYYFIIKKLPHEDMSRNDLIAISNGQSLIAIVIPFILLAFMGTNPAVFQRNMMMLYLLHPVVFGFLAFSTIILFLYLLGVAISAVYAKYKRAKAIGISAWKIICSMPFTFLLMWTPGYLILEKDKPTNLEIKSRWYTKFNNWVLSDNTNILFTFLLFLLLKNVFAGLPVLILSAALLIVFALWTLKYKTTLMKNINKGYALTAVLINITMIIVLTIFA